MGWLGTWRGVLWTGGLAAVMFLVRAFMDFRFVYPEFTAADDLGTATLSFAVYGGVAAVWIWALIAVARERRRGAVAVALLAGVWLVVMWLATAIAFCPFPCPSLFPLGEIVNTGGLLAGLLAVAAAISRLRAAA
jgi:hypothetical protein